MATFEGAVLKQTVAVARVHGIEPAALLAVVEVESAGKALEIDGVTPCLLFERHIFYRELKKAKKLVALGRAIQSGLANESWQPKTQYTDQRTSQQRLELLAKAKAINEECAVRSCSWGVGQTMGFLAEELHFPNAVMMLGFMTAGGVPAQVECMVKEIENKKLIGKLNLHDWAGFARIYNGPGYKANRYDIKMAAAHARWRHVELPQTDWDVNPPAPDPVVVPDAVKPVALVEAPPPVNKHIAIGLGVLASLTAVWEAIKRVPLNVAAFSGMMAAMLVITAIVLYQRHRAAQLPALGILAATRGD